MGYSCDDFDKLSGFITENLTALSVFYGRMIRSDILSSNCAIHVRYNS